MAKRFTDTEKWKKGWFDELPHKFKFVWMWLCDNCDHAGIWDPSFRLLEFQTGIRSSRTELVEVFKGRIVEVGEGKLWLKSFPDFQYGALNPNNRAHRSVIDRLQKVGASKGLNSPSKGGTVTVTAKELDMDKDLGGVQGGSPDDPWHVLRTVSGWDDRFQEPIRQKLQALAVQWSSQEVVDRAFPVGVAAFAGTYAAEAPDPKRWVNSLGNHIHVAVREILEGKSDPARYKPRASKGYDFLED